MDMFDLGLLEQRGHAAAKPADNAVLPCDCMAEVDRRGAGGDAERALAGGGMGGLFKLLCGVDQRLGGNAADIEAGAARPSRFHDNGVQAKLARPDSADISAGAGADDEQLAGDFFHRSGSHGELATPNAADMARGPMAPCSAIPPRRSA